MGNLSTFPYIKKIQNFPHKTKIVFKNKNLNTENDEVNKLNNVFS